MDMNAFTIRDLENLSGVKAHTIRIWELRYSFLTPQRTDTNIRYYSSDDLQKLLNVALLNRFGYKISHIDRMSAKEMGDKVLALTQAEAQHERLVNELIHCLAQIKMEEFEKALSDFIKLKGIEKTIHQIIFPFLERIGILWLTGNISPAQEHLVSNIIRQKLIVGIDGCKEPIQTAKKVLLFLPSGEHHELGLLFMHYLLKRQGVDVLYIGSNIPFKDVESVVKVKHPDILYSHLTGVSDKFSLEKFLLNIYNRLPDKQIVVSGALTHNYKKKLPPNAALKTSFAEVTAFINSL